MRALFDTPLIWALCRTERMSRADGSTMPRPLLASTKPEAPSQPWSMEDELVKRSPALFSVLLMAASLATGASESPHFEFTAPAWAEGRALGEQFDEIFAIVAGRVGVSLDAKVPVMFSPPGLGHCRPRGSTMILPERSENDPIAIVQIFADEDTDQHQILAALAHELGHVLNFAAIEGGRSIASMFLEGFATWAAGPYWLRWQGVPSFQSAVASYIDNGAYIPLHENEMFLDTLTEEAASRLGEDCLRRRDVIYTEWAAFIEYLVEQYGRERLYSLFQTPPLSPDTDEEEVPIGRPNYPAVYGASLEQLEAEWLESISVSR